MRANELRKYKTLDITELSGSPWNNAEKVLGLDENDKVIMAEPDDVVTPEYVDNAIDQAMEAETARTEDAYAKKDEIPDMEDYYTKEEVDEAISGITVDLSDYYTKEEVDELIEEIPEPDLSNYYTKGETDGAISTALVPYATKGWVESKTYVNGAFVDAKVNEAMQSETARTESTYAKPSDIPSLDGYATEEYVDNAVSSATQDMATEQYVNDAIAAIPVVDLSGYAKTTAVTQDIQTAIATETGRTESVYAKKSEIPSLDNYYNKDQVDAKVSAAEQYADSIVEGLATETYVDDAIAAIPPVDLSGYALISSVTADINTAIANETARTESTYAKPSQIPSLDGYATEQWVESQGYLTEHQDLSAYAKTTAVTKDIQTAMAVETARTESTYLKEHQSLANYYNKGQVDGMFSSAATLTANAIDAAETRANAYAESVVDGYATEQYVDDAIAGIPTPPTDYATQEDIDAAVQGLASESYVDSAVADLATTGDVANAVEGLASQEYVDNAVNDLTLGIGMLGMVNDVSESNGTVTVRKTGMQDGHLVTGSTSFNIATPGDIQTAIASETARTESTYLKEHQSLDNYYTKSQVDAEITGATEDMATKTWVGQQGYLTQHQDISGKLDKTDFNTYTGATETALAEKLDASAYTVDNAIDSTSTNPVENRVINAALNGVTSSTQMEISSVDSTIQLQYRFYGNPNSNYMNANFKETNIDGYYVIDLGDLPVGGAQNISELRLSYIIINNTYYAFENYSPDTSNLGQKVPLSLSGTYLRMILGSLGDTYDYYLVLKANEDYVFLSATLPSIETISDHKANISDLPTAQDGSGFNQFVYNGSGNKAVLSKFSPNYRQNISSNNRQSQITFNITPWGGSASQYSVNLPKGNECVDGVKTDRDSQVISKAEEALNGFSEQITLTLGSRSSTDKINMTSDLYLYETNYPRYLAIPTSEAIVGMIQRVILSGTAYYVQNPISQDNYRPVTGKYQLGTISGTFLFNKEIVGNTYIIIDTELLTLEIADSLTITRAKSIPEAISAATQNMVTSGDVATQIDTAMASETGRTESTYAKPSDIPSLSGYATETWVQNQGYLTQHQDISGKLDKTDFNTYTGATQTILAGKADVGDIPTVPTNVSAFTNDAGYLTQHQSLANYYTKTEIDGMIGDIESLLASI